MSNLIYQDKESPWSSHSCIIEILELLPANSKVLDIGTASGMLARRANLSLRFFGVESNAEWAQMASPFYEKLWDCSFDEMQDENLRGYDCIVLGDVLEHMAEPAKALTRLVGLQTSGSMFIISVPNIANIWVRLNLLIGNFNYAERGILDKTHLRFFTRKTIVELLAESKLKIFSIHVTPIPLELVSPFFITSLGRLCHAVLAWLTFLFPTLLGYQFILKAKKYE